MPAEPGPGPGLGPATQTEVRGPRRGCCHASWGAGRSESPHSQPPASYPPGSRSLTEGCAPWGTLGLGSWPRALVPSQWPEDAYGLLPNQGPRRGKVVPHCSQHPAGWLQEVRGPAYLGHPARLASHLLRMSPPSLRAVSFVLGSHKHVAARCCLPVPAPSLHFRAHAGVFIASV